MTKCVARRYRIWLKALIGVSILCGATVWTNGNSPVAEDTQPNQALTIQANSSGAPDIFFAETTHAFGKIFVGEKTEHVFKFVNRGNAPLDISEITVGCDCTVAKLKKWLIAPGEEEEIKVIFSPDENTKPGKTAKFVYVNSNDPDSPRFKLKFTANVRKDVFYTPGKFELGFVPKGNTGTKRIVFESKLNPTDFKITKVTTFSPSVGVAYGQLTDKGQWYVESLIKEDAKPEHLAGNITVFTNSPKQPEINISTYADVVGEVKVLPERICFGKVTKGAEVVRSLTVFHAKNLKVEKVEPSLSWISATLAPNNNSTDDNPSVNVEVKLSSNDAPKGRFEGTLSIYTNSKKAPVAKIHICANVKESQI